ncbi:MAG TPA: ATP-binding protein, partial [Armatimonadota bacterium]
VPAQPLDLKDAVAKVEGMLGRLIGEDIELRTSIGPDPVTVMADPGQVEQIILNLCLNARDAMPSGGRLTLGLHSREASGRDFSAPRRAAPGEYAVLVVEDTGVGMDSAVMHRIFEPFFTTKDGMGKGTGLGLSTVYGIAQQMGGTVEVSSMPGEGSRFEVWLPLCADARVSEPSSAMAAPVPEGRETILLVEDEDTVRDLVAQVLAAHGYTVLKARHGEDALGLLRSFNGSVDLLLTDVVMPRMGGRELAERVDAQRPGTPVIFMSGYTDDVTLRNGVWSCERVYLQKPFRMGDLARKIREVLDAQALPPRP